MKIQPTFQMEGFSKCTISLEDQKTLILQRKESSENKFEGSQPEKQGIKKGPNTLTVRVFEGAAATGTNGGHRGTDILIFASKAHAGRTADSLDKP